MDIDLRKGEDTGSAVLESRAAVTGESGEADSAAASKCDSDETMRARCLCVWQRT